MVCIVVVVTVVLLVTKEDSPNDAERLRTFLIQKSKFLEDGHNPEMLLNNASTPQYKAYQWLLTDMAGNDNDDSALLQR